MEKATRETVKIRREKWKVSDAAKNNLKEFNRLNDILQELAKEDLTVAQLCDRTGMPKDEVVYSLLSLVKFGFVETGNIDDMDEYYNYKIKRQ